jgi:hypothetical protein
MKKQGCGLDRDIIYKLVVLVELRLSKVNAYREEFVVLVDYLRLL